MGSRYSGADIEKIRSSTDISSVVGRFVQLKKSGASYRGLCPFHKEKTPSFFVSPERQTYHCFGCGTGGDVFSFLMNYLSLSFPESVEELAAEAGIELTPQKGSSERTDVIRKILSATQEFFTKQLTSAEGSAARAYLTTRDLAEYAGELGIGYAPEGSSLLRFLRAQGYSEPVLVEAGVVLSGKSGQGAYDRFRKRLTFPICDRRGRPVSFGARVLTDGEPKYLNGPESPIYSKGSTLYGYRSAAKAARDLDMVILVEGYFDHARLWAAGFHSTVATCGTALTDAQARQLGSISSDIFICYDSDPAGHRAAVRAAEALLGEGHYPRIVALPEGDDPDDYVQARGADSFWDLLRNASNPVEYCLGLLGGWGSIPSGKKQVDVIRRLVRVASASRDPVVRENLLRTIAGITDYSLETLSEEVDEVRRKDRRQSKTKGAALSGWDRDLLRTLLVQEGFTAGLMGRLGEDDFGSVSGKRIYKALSRQAEEGYTSVSLASLDDEVSGICAGLITHSDTFSDEELKLVFGKIEVKRFEREKRRLQEALVAAEGEEKMEILRSLHEVSSELHRLEGSDEE